MPRCAVALNSKSISVLDNTGLTTTFVNSKGIIQKADGTTILVGKQVNRIYLLNPLKTKYNIP